MRKVSTKEGVPAQSCRSCTPSGKLLARNTNIDEQIYLSTAGKGLRENPVLDPFYETSKIACKLLLL